MTGYIILFDGFCNFCNFWVNFILDKDKEGRFKFTALQSGAGQKLLAKFNLPEDNFETFILIKDNKYFTRSSAALIIAKNLKGFWKLFYAFVIIPRPVRNFVYNFIANTRYKLFGKREVCRIPTDEEKERFL